MEILKRASVIAVGIVLGAVLALTASTHAFKNLSNDERADKFGVIMEIIMDETINEEGVADPDYLYNIAIQAVFKELGDQHGQYLTKEITKVVKEEMTPINYGGIGTSITEYKKGALVGAMLLSPFEKGPAFRTGLRTGDIITHVLVGKKWRKYEEDNLNEFIKFLKGPKGTKVTVKVVSHSDKKGVKVVTMIRAQTKLQDVWVHVIGPVVYARVDQFSTTADTDLKKKILPAIKKLKQKNNFKGIVLDFRSNPGGVLRASVRLADLFINKGKEIITVKSRKEPDYVWKAKKKPIVSERTPMVVLIDGGSASASELVAGALMQQEVAISMGVKTFGKGSVQTLVDISDGSSVKVTSARYYPAGGLNVDGVGIEPTIKVEPRHFIDEFASDEVRREQYLQYYFARTSADPGRDNQLLQAIKYIRSR